MSDNPKSKWFKPFLPEYCDKLVEVMGKGFSFEAFCGSIDISRKLGYLWLKAHPEFAEAKEIAGEANRYFWEREGIVGLQGNKDGHLNSSVWIFNMKNRHGWRDRTEIFGRDEGPIVLSNLTEGQIDERVGQICNRLLLDKARTTETESTEQEPETDSPPVTTD